MKMTKQDGQKQDPTLKELVDLIKQDSRRQDSNEKGNVPRDRPFSKPKKKSLSCGDDTQLANECPKKSRCYNCHNTGHIFYDCP